MHALTRRTARIFARNLGAQIQKVVQNPLLLLTILAATYGIVEAVEGFVQRFGLVVVPFSLLVFAILIYFHFRDQIDIFPGRPIERKADRIVVPADVNDPDNFEDVTRVIEACQGIFGSTAIDPIQDMVSWRNDPYSMVILKAGDGIVGFLDFYFYGRADFDRYLDGEMDFDQLHRTHTLAHPDARRAEVVYVGTVVHFDYVNYLRNDSQYSIEVSDIVEGALEAILKYQDFGSAGIDFYATGWSPEGRRLLGRYGFVPDGRRKPKSWFEKPTYVRPGVTREQVVAMHKSLSGRRKRIARRI